MTMTVRAAGTDVGTYDVVVYGGTAAGVTAAVQAKRMGKSVILVCPDRHLGGLSSGGLGWTDTGNKAVIGGLAREFYHRVWKHYDRPAAWKWQSRAEYGNRGQGTPAIDGEQRTMWIFEPHVAERIFDDLIAEHGIPVHRNEWLDRENGVKKRRGRITSITMQSGRTCAGRMFIDATYEGDLMAAANVEFHVGREASDVYGEQWNGVQVGVLHHGHWFKKPVDPYVMPGDPTSGLLPRISPDPPGKKGDGDHRIQAYCFRMCLTDDPRNRVPFSKPEGYDPKDYELLARVFATGWRETFNKFDAIPNRKTDTNNHGPFSTDNIGYNYDYPEASYARRRQIIEEHERYQKGLMYFLANDPRVPVEVRTEMATYGLARDEFIDNDNWPHQIYVRESRRMIGAYVMTEHDCLAKRDTPNSVAMGSYTMDSHNVQRYVTPDGYVQNEGDIGVRPRRPYRIAYGSLAPKKAQCENLLVPVCVSASHIAFGTIRMEPVFMILGQSAATAAVLSIESDVAVQDLPYADLHARLVADGQVLDLTEGQARRSRDAATTNREKNEAIAHRFDPVVREIEGWTVHVEPALIDGEHRQEGVRALKMLANHLQRIAVLMPEDRLRRMRKLEIWIEHHHPTLGAMQYHPSVGWLESHGHDPRLAKKVHMPRAKSLLSRRQMIKHPAVVLHELAHAYHDQYLSFDHPGIVDAYQKAKANGSYENVLLYTGKRVDHYALSNHKEYFAEGTEAYFYRNDFYPFVRAELQEHDPALHALLVEIWGPLE